MCLVGHPQTFQTSNLLFPKLPSPDKEPQTIRVSGERVKCSQMHPVPTCHFCVPLGDRIIDRAQEKPQRIKGSGGKLQHSYSK